MSLTRLPCSGSYTEPKMLYSEARLFGDML